MEKLFTETYKAIAAAKEIEDSAFKEMTLEEELKLVEEELKNTRNPEEYDFLKERKDKLEKDIRFRPRKFELDPEMHKVIKSNYEKELEIARNERNERLKQIETVLTNAIKEVGPLLQDLKQLNEKMTNAEYVKPVLAGEIRSRPVEDIQYIPFGRKLNNFPTNNIHSNNIITKAEKMLKTSTEALLRPQEFIYRGNTIGKSFID